MVIISYNHSVPPVLAAIEVRKQYYNIVTYPMVNFDGADVVFEPNPNAYDTTFNQHIQTAKSVVPIYNLTLNGTITATSGVLHVKISPADTLMHDSVYAFVAVCQDSAIGEFLTVCNYVIRQFYQFPVNLFYPDSLDTIINFSHSIPQDKLRGVLFVQDMHANSKKVLQASKVTFMEEK